MIRIKATINKIPGANWRAAMLKKDMPLMLNRFGGWLNYPEYFFFWNYHGQNAVFNTMSYQNAEMDRLIDAARFENDRKKYRGRRARFCRPRIRRRAARADRAAQLRRRDAEKRQGLPLLVSPAAGLPQSGESVGERGSLGAPCCA